MKELFKQYLKKERISEALLVGQNILNKDINDFECFDLYFNLIMSLAKSEEEHDRERFIKQATGTLTFFAENADLNANLVEYIKCKETEIDDARKELLKTEISKNDEALTVLKKLMAKLNEQNDKNGFEKTLNQISQVDGLIKDNYLSERQRAEYEMITNQCSELVNKKMQLFTNQERVNYNLNAIQAYENVFNFFRNKEVVGEHKDIIKSLFKFDASKLFNETLIYYNHVYNYILSKMNDEEKFLITKYAIMSEKMR